jgi:hypothetical protein
MHAATGSTLWTVDEHVDVHDVVINESGGFECRSDGGKVWAAHQDIDVPCVPDGVFIDPRHPLGDSVNDGLHRNASTGAKLS